MLTAVGAYADRLADTTQPSVLRSGADRRHSEGGFEQQLSAYTTTLPSPYSESASIARQQEVIGRGAEAQIASVYGAKGGREGRHEEDRCGDDRTGEDADSDDCSSGSDYSILSSPSESDDEGRKAWKKKERARLDHIARLVIMAQQALEALAGDAAQSGLET